MFNFPFENGFSYLQIHTPCVNDTILKSGTGHIAYAYNSHWAEQIFNFLYPLAPIRFLLRTPRSRILLEKLTVNQPAKKFITFYGTQRFITVFTRARHWSLSYVKCAQCTLYFLKINSNIIFPCTPTYSEWSLPFGFSE